MHQNDVGLNTVVQVAEELGLSPRAVLHRITRGTIAATKIGNGQTSAYVIRDAELRRLKREQREAKRNRAVSS